nr:MAG TPA: hypothetical protein [Caudoviricetes sp.]
MYFPACKDSVNRNQYKTSRLVFMASQDIQHTKRGRSL